LPSDAGKAASSALRVDGYVAACQVCHLVRHHALQLVAAEPLDRAAGQDHRRILARQSHRQRVDRQLALQHVQARDRLVRRQRHLLDHVDDPSLEQRERAGAGEQWPRPQPLGHHCRIVAQALALDEGAGQHQAGGGEGVDEQEAIRQGRRPEDQAPCHKGGHVEHHHHAHHRKGVGEPETAGGAGGF